MQALALRTVEALLVTCLYRKSERMQLSSRHKSSLTLPSGTFGWYILGPLLGPTLGPLFGGLIVENLGWRWIFWVLTIVCMINTLLGIFFLKETYAPVILQARRNECEKQGSRCRLNNELEDDRPLNERLLEAMQRPLKILFLQPIVFTMVGILSCGSNVHLLTLTRHSTKQSPSLQLTVYIQISRVFMVESMDFQ